MKAKYLVLLIAFLITTKGFSQTCDCLVPIDGSFTSLPRYDDGSTSAIPLPFSFCLYGSTYSSAYVNNNGNITFGGAVGNYSASGFPFSGYKMIAPLWADVDTRNLASGLVYYKVTPTALIVRWNNVGYYNQKIDKLNDFQVIITNSNDPLVPGGYNVSFCYGDMQWTSGDASGGTNGLGGSPSTAGVNAGDGTNYWQIGRFNQAGTGYNGSLGANDSVDWLDNKAFYANVCVVPDTIDPYVVNTDYCDTINLLLGETSGFNMFLMPQFGGDITVTIDTTNISGFTYQLTQGANYAQIQGSMTASTLLQGINELVVNVDNSINGARSLATKQYKYYFNVEGCTITQPINIIGEAEICRNSSAILQAPTGYKYYLWKYDNSNNDSLVVTDSGQYILVVTNNTGCKGSDTITVEYFPEIDFDIQSSGLYYNGQDTVFYCSNFGDYLHTTPEFGYYYQWSYNNSTGNILDIPGSEDTTFVLYITATDSITGCSLTKSITLTGETCGGIGENTLVNTIKLYPNPATENLVWNIKEDVAIKDGIIQLYSSAGQMVFSKNITSPTETIDISGLAQGTYYLKTILKDGVKVSPFVKISN